MHIIKPITQIFNRSALLLACSLTTAMATEEIQHTVLETAPGNIEVRQYQPVVAARVTVQGTQREAPSKAFMQLFKYISGENVAAKEIPMTAPVSQQAVQNEGKPNGANAKGSTTGTWEIGFYMPASMALAEAPRPKNENITIGQVPARKMAAISFRGNRDDANIAKHEAQLRAYLKQHNIAFEDDPLYAFYSAPYVPWFLKRNEVLFPLSSP